MATETKNVKYAPSSRKNYRIPNTTDCECHACSSEYVRRNSNDWARETKLAHLEHIGLIG